MKMNDNKTAREQQKNLLALLKINVETISPLCKTMLVENYMLQTNFM